MPQELAAQSEARRKSHAARWALISNGTLLALKVVIGAITGSVAVLAEVVNSAADLIGSLIVYLSVKISDEPPDASHAYGHGKIENLSGIAVATLIFVGGITAIWHAIQHITHPEPISHLWGALSVMGASVIINMVVSRHLLTVGRETDSPALPADGKHLRTDVLTSIGAFVGLALVGLTARQYWDSVAAFGVSAMILHTGYGLARDAVHTLSDYTLPPEEVKILEDVLNENPEVLSFHKLRTRKSGSHRHADVHVLIADTHTFVDAHRLTEELEDQMRDALPNMHPIIHMEPYEEEIIHQRERHGVDEKNNKLSS